MSKREKMFTLVEDFRASGLTGKAFCQTHGIVTSTLYYWVKKFNESASPGGFVIEARETLKFSQLQIK